MRRLPKSLVISAFLGPVLGFACSSADNGNPSDMGDDDAGRQVRWDAGRVDGPSILGNGPVLGTEDPEDDDPTPLIDAGKKDGPQGDPVTPFTCSRTGSGASAVLVINEVDYDQPGSDDAEFIELLNPSASASVNLAAYEVVLINGAQSTSGRKDYDHIPLTGTLGPKGYLVIADPAVSVAAGAAVIRLAATQSIQNGPNDAVAIMKNSEVIDSVSYGGAVSDPCNFVEGTATKAYDSNSIVGSLIRDPNGTDTGNADADWKFTSTPTPGKTNELRRGDAGP